MKKTIVLLTLSLLGSGCYLKPTWTNNPLVSSEGITLRVLGVDCEDHQGTDSEPTSRDLGIKVLVENPTDRVLKVSEEAISLMADGQPGSLRFPVVAEVQPHGSSKLRWSFTHQATCSADREFAINLAGAFQLGTAEVQMAALRVRP
jgi:hypothetical protein